MDGTHYRLCAMSDDQDDLYLCTDPQGNVFWASNLDYFMSESVWYYYVSEVGPKFRSIFGGTLKPHKDSLVTQKHCIDRTDTWEVSLVSKKIKDVYFIKSTDCSRYISTKRSKLIDADKGTYQAALDPRLSFMSLGRSIKFCPVPGIEPPPYTPLPPVPPMIFGKVTRSGVAQERK